SYGLVPVISDSRSAAAPAWRSPAGSDSLCSRRTGRGSTRISASRSGRSADVPADVPRLAQTANVSSPTDPCLAYLTPEAKARVEIDRMLAAAGWVVQDYARVNLAAARGVAVREFVLAPPHGRADYL